MGMLGRFIRTLLITVISFCFIEVSAEELPIVMNTYTTDDSVVMYVRNHEIDRIFIGNQECSDFKVSESDGVRTFILLDNSYSINKNYREDIKSFLKSAFPAY